MAGFMPGRSSEETGSVLRLPTDTYLVPGSGRRYLHPGDGMRAYLEVWKQDGRQLVPLERDRITVGRDASSDVAVPEDGRPVGRRGPDQTVREV